MICAKITIFLVAQIYYMRLPIVGVTGVPLHICEYRVGDVSYKEKQFGQCTAQPKRIPRQVYEQAVYRACSGR